MENAENDAKRCRNPLFGLAPMASVEDTINEGNNRMISTIYNQTWHYAKGCESTSLQIQANSIDRTNALTTLTPRIDISRASSHSSHHDSRDSSPDNVFDQVGTGTLQDEGVLGYREEGTIDLRSSTEELQFLEHVKGVTEKENPQAQPIPFVMHKLEQHNTSLHHLYKDSTCSEDAAFLGISGRTSRISSVGSQGSANSKLSVASDACEINRSPSPHRMLLETSFCGTKPSQVITDGSISSSIEPSTAKILEQVILSRKNDPTEAVLAEGIDIKDQVSINNTTKQNKSTENKFNRRKSESNAYISLKDELIIPHASRSISNNRYIPPTDLNKPIVGVMPSGTEYIRIKLKPDHCYSDNGIADNEQILQDEQKKNYSLNYDYSEDKKASNNNNPKLIHHFKLPPKNDSRSPSPANTEFSRKNSFCSIFKIKELAHLDSSGVCHVQKKSGSISHELTECSHTTNREKDFVSLNTTPNRQNSVLAMFKHIRNEAKSKSPSLMNVYQQDNIHNKGNENLRFENSVSHHPLKYYDTPLDGRSIHIPLHTPPEEKHCMPFLSSNLMQPLEPKTGIIKEKASPIKLSNNCIVTIHNRPKPMTPLKCYRIENSDGTITIPLKSPPEEKEQESLWSVKETTISGPGHAFSSTIAASHKENKNSLSLTYQSNMHDRSANETDIFKTVNDDCGVVKMGSLTTKMSPKPEEHCLFSMQMGSGSQEQMFTTQFCISKTVSQSSQLSEIPKNDPSEKLNAMISETSHTIDRNEQMCSVLKENPNKKHIHLSSTSGDYIDVHLHSRYIENSNKILNMQQQYKTEKPKNKLNTSVSVESTTFAEISRDESTVHMLSKNAIDRTSTASNDEQGASTGSERDYEADTNKHLLSSMLAIEDHESTGLVLHESFDDELPYIPTTLPEERAVGFKLIPMKERAQIEIKTFPLERPKSTTPIHPSAFENYYNVIHPSEESEGNLIHSEKLKISLPRKQHIDKEFKLGLLRKTSTPSWLEFVDHNSTEAQPPTREEDKNNRSNSSNVEEQPPPLLPRKDLTQQWVDFNNIPDKRKPAKRIASVSQTAEEDVLLTQMVYNYVQPEECQCECHENKRGSVEQQPLIQAQETENKQSLLQRDLLNTSYNGGKLQSTILDESLDE